MQNFIFTIFLFCFVLLVGCGEKAREKRPLIVKSVSTRTTHTCAIKEDGTLWCWGDNEGGELGDGSYNSKNIPERIGSESNWLVVSVGSAHTCALKEDRTLWCWGINEPVWKITNQNNNIPLQLEGNWFSVSAGLGHTCGIKSDNTLWCWGDNFWGQIGDGTGGSFESNKNIPVNIGNNSKWKSISAGGSQTCAIKIDGTLWCWGINIFGQLGNGTYDNSPLPVQAGTDTDWTMVSTFTTDTCGIKTDKTLWCWGGNEGKIPKLISKEEWLGVSTGEWKYCGVKIDNTLWCLREDLFFGHKLKQIDDYKDWLSISFGTAHTCAIKTDNTLWCWGDNIYGQLGTGDYEFREEPTQVFYYP